MRHEQPQLVGRGPAQVTGLAAAAGFGLLDRPLDRNDDVTERLAHARRQWERGPLGLGSAATVMARKRLWGEDREGQYVRRT
ncbi:MAG: hypothetical protein M3067_07125 [Chloroflexota bacterium]|nr:hypothetical protein [Chloroflexota bacterium]